MWSELVPQVVAVVAGRDDVRTMLAAILLGHQVFARGFQTGGLTQREPMGGGEAGGIGEPHGELAVVAAATLHMEGSIAGGGIALGHGGILEARGEISRRLDTGRAGTCSHRHAGTTPGLISRWQALYRAKAARVSRLAA